MKKISKSRAVFLGVFAAAAVTAISATAYTVGGADSAKVTYTDLTGTTADKVETVDLTGPKTPTGIPDGETDSIMDTNHDIVFQMDDTTGEVKLLTTASTINSDIHAYYLPKGVFDELNTPPAEHPKQADVSGDITWFIYKNKMYVLGLGDATGTLTVTPKNTHCTDGNISETLMWNEPMYADLSAITAEYGDINGSGYGVKLPAIGDEKTFDGFYDYTARTETGEVVIADPIADSRGTVVVEPSGYLSASQMNSDIAGFEGVPWRGSDVSKVEEVFLGADVKLAGNMSYLFNMETSANIRVKVGDTVLYDGIQNDSRFESLQKIYFNADTSDVTYAAGMFARIPNLTDIKTAKTINLNNARTTTLMFFGDTKLKNGAGSFIDAIDLSTNAWLKDTSWMFAGCESISKPNVKGYKMDLVQDATGMFLGAKNAQLSFDAADGKSDMSSWNLSALVSAIDMFSGSTFKAPTTAAKPISKNPGFGELSSDKFGKVVVGAVDLTKWDAAGGLPNLISAQNMFALNDGITSVKLPATELTNLEDASEVFVRNDGLEKVEGTLNAPKLKYAQYAFMGSGKSNATVDVELTVPLLENVGFAFYDSGFSELDFTNGTTTLGELTKAFAAFADMDNVTKINLGDKVFSGLTDAQYMFYNDPKLSLLSGDATANGATFNMKDLKNGSFMFTNDTALKKLNTSEWKLENATGINLENFIYNTNVDAISLAGVTAGNHIEKLSLAFANAPSLAKVTLPADGFPNLTNGFGMFSDDPALTTIAGPAAIPAAKAVDVRGMFANDVSLTSEGALQGPGQIITGETKYASYMYKNCPKLTTVNLSQIIPTALEYAQGMFDGDTGLGSVTVGAYADILPAAKSMGAMFRNTNLNQASFATLLDKIGTLPQDSYAAFEGNRNITTADLSGVNFANATDISRMFANCDRLGVITQDDLSSLPSDTLPKIKVPTTFGMSVSDANNRKNVFYVQYDKDANTLNPDKADDDVLTYLVSAGTVLPDTIKAYPFTKDNRKFAGLLSRTINGLNVGTYTYGTEETDPVLRVTIGTSAMTTDGTGETALPVGYAWSVKTPSGTTTDLGEDDSDYIAPKDEYGDGKKYTILAAYKPKGMTGVTEGSVPFVLNAKVTGIEATYIGDKVPIGKNYDKDKVTVNAILSDGEKIPISSALWTPDSTKVTKPGDNPFKATYIEDGKTYTADFVVPGARLIDRIETVYSGPSVLVGDTWKEANVETVGYYADDVHKVEGIPITPTYYSGKLIRKIGSNTFTATYVDPAQDGKTFSSTFDVPGYKEVGYIKADYTGPSITVGEDYDKAKVRVTAFYADGTGSSVLSVKDWTADSLTVQEEGDNSFTASYRDPFGTTFTAGYSVKGVVKKPASSSEPTSSASGEPASSASSSEPTSSAASSDPEGRPDNGEPSPYADLTNTYSGYPENPTPARQGTTGVSSYTGKVQTGNAVMIVLYLIAFAGAALGILAAIIIKRKNKDTKNKD